MGWGNNQQRVFQFGGALCLSDNPEGQESEGSKAVNLGWLSTGREETEL